MQLVKIYSDFKKNTDKALCIITKEYREYLNFYRCNYIFNNNSHYRVVVKADKLNKKKIKVRRGMLLFDIERVNLEIQFFERIHS